MMNAVTMPRVPSGASMLRWCDLDGEFLTERGFARVACSTCSGPAVALWGAVACCGAHLPAGTVPPSWMVLCAAQLLRA